jgi:hypothetical protein
MFSDSVFMPAFRAAGLTVKVTLGAESADMLLSMEESTAFNGIAQGAEYQLEWVLGDLHLALNSQITVDGGVSQPWASGEYLVSSKPRCEQGWCSASLVRKS